MLYLLLATSVIANMCLCYHIKEMYKVTSKIHDSAVQKIIRKSQLENNLPIEYIEVYLTEMLTALTRLTRKGKEPR